MITSSATRIVLPEMLEHLPAPVQRYMRYTGVVGQPWIDTATIKYTGRFRMGSDKPWMHIDAHQVYTTKPAGFRWKARFSMVGVPFMFADDVYKAGHSRMFGKLGGLITVVDGTGPEVDQGTRVRYLQEMSWFPIGYLGENITWQAVDDHAADVTFTDEGQSVSARMYFDDEGRQLNFEARRYRSAGKGYEMNTWTTPLTDYAIFCGLRIPAGGQGVWLLPSGDLPYIDIRLQEVVYNQPVAPF